MSSCPLFEYSGAARRSLLGLALIVFSALPVIAETVDFSRQVLPILSNKCFVCHGPDSKKAKDLRLDSYKAATADRGGYKAIDPDQPEESEALARIHDSEDPMPPKKAEKKLTEDERAILTKWIKGGGKYSAHWALVPPVKKQSKAETDAIGSKAIDAFIVDGMQSKDVALAKPADKATLARRASLVLTGLPPEPTTLEKHLRDESADAYAKWVESLLASPKYGEHQARYWLDAVRYGDTHGLHLDNKRGIYPYRDWVIHALNENLPLDEFIVWQLAGDLLPNPTLGQLAATGFVRMNPTTSEGGAIAAEFQAKNNFDRVETLGTVFLGASLTCARCHNHKYDPIEQKEYYELMAFFNSTSEKALDGNSYTYGPVIKVPASVEAWEDWSGLERARDEMLAKAGATVAFLAPEAKQVWAAADTEERLRLLADSDSLFDGLEFTDQATFFSSQTDKQKAAFTTSLVARDLDKPRTTQVLQRGEYHLPMGDPLKPDIVSVMGTFPEDEPRNRLGLAKWLTSRQHPLVARVLINRIWQRTFGYGLVRTPEEFGLQGDQPTHPELLDWLAVELQESGWDLKHMLRLMVTSQAFRQTSEWRDDFNDPENLLFARGPSHRLDAEVIRDVGLWASELLDPFMGGEGVKPYQPDGLWSALAHPASNTKKYARDSGDLLYRRSLYVYWKRTSPHPMMTLFDAPSREASCVRRSRTNTSLQSLGLFNETQRLEMGRKLGERLLRNAKDDNTRLNLLYKLIASREPTASERTACTTLLSTLRDRYKDAKEDANALLATGDAPRNKKLDAVEAAAWAQVATTVLASDAAILLY